MRALILSGALALGLSAGPLAPATAEAGHRHSRHCGHSTSYRYDRGPAPYGYGYGSPYAYGGGYGYRYSAPYPAYRSSHRHHSGCGHVSYGYGYAYGPPAYVVLPPPPLRCVRPRVSIHLGF